MDKERFCLILVGIATGRLLEFIWPSSSLVVCICILLAFLILWYLVSTGALD